MVKAVFFDWANTLARLEPEASELVYQVAQELGVELSSPQRLRRGIYIADNQAFAGSPALWSEGKDEVPLIRWWGILSAEVGARLSREVMLEITRRLSQRVRKLTWVLYDDVLPTVKALRQGGLLLGLITSSFLSGVGAGLVSYLDFVVTAQEVGADKPEPPIFLAALERAKVNAQEAIYVGDQYQRDVLGARGVGITPILIDRYDLVPEVSDCPRIHGLAELDKYL